MQRLVGSRCAVIWRCHIGRDDPTQQPTRAGHFLRPYLDDAHAFVFSRAAYVSGLGAV